MQAAKGSSKHAMISSKSKFSRINPLDGEAFLHSRMKARLGLGKRREKTLSEWASKLDTKDSSGRVALALPRFHCVYRRQFFLKHWPRYTFLTAGCGRLNGHQAAHPTASLPWPSPRLAYSCDLRPQTARLKRQRSSR